MLFPGVDRVRTFRNNTGHWAGSTHFKKTHVNSKAPTLFHTHHRSLSFCRLQSTRTQSCYCLHVTACMDGAINNARPCHINLLSKVKRKEPTRCDKLCSFIATCFGHQTCPSSVQLVNSTFRWPYLESRLDCGHILRAVHTPSSPALHNPGGFPGMAT
jgi:hypothetical protein